METTFFYDTFSRLCRERGEKPSTVVTKIGLSTPNATYWKQGSIPKFETVKKLSEYFGVKPTVFLAEPSLDEEDESWVQVEYEGLHEGKLEADISEALKTFYSSFSDEDIWQMIKEYYDHYNSRRKRIELLRQAREIDDRQFYELTHEEWTQKGQEKPSQDPEDPETAENSIQK